MISTLGGRFPRANLFGGASNRSPTSSGAQDVGQLDVATGRGGLSLTSPIVPLPCHNKDFRLALFPLESPPIVPIT